MSLDDRQLLMRMHNGDEAAARMLCERFSLRLVAYAASLLRDRAEAHDAIQSVLLRILSLKRWQLEAVNDVPAWLLTLTRNQVITGLRTVRRDAARQRSVSRPETIAPAPLAKTGTLPGVDAVRAAIESLPRRLREVVVLKHVAGLTFDQMALALSARIATPSPRDTGPPPLQSKRCSRSPTHRQIALALVAPVEQMPSDANNAQIRVLNLRE